MMKLCDFFGSKVRSLQDKSFAIKVGPNLSPLRSYKAVFVNVLRDGCSERPRCWGGADVPQNVTALWLNRAPIQQEWTHYHLAKRVVSNSSFTCLDRTWWFPVVIEEASLMLVQLSAMGSTFQVRCPKRNDLPMSSSNSCWCTGLCLKPYLKLKMTSWRLGVLEATWQALGRRLWVEALEADASRTRVRLRCGARWVCSLQLLLLCG